MLRRSAKVVESRHFAAVFEPLICLDRSCSRGFVTTAADGGTTSITTAAAASTKRRPAGLHSEALDQPVAELLVCRLALITGGALAGRPTALPSEVVSSFVAVSCENQRASGAGVRALGRMYRASLHQYQGVRCAAPRRLTSIGSPHEMPYPGAIFGPRKCHISNGLPVPLPRLVLRGFWRQNGVKAPLPGRLESVRSEL